MAVKIQSKYSSKVNCPYGVTSGMWLPSSFKTKENDIKSDDGYGFISITNQVKILEEYTKSQMLNVFREVGGNIPTTTTWNELIQYIYNIVSNVESIKIFEYTGEVQTYEILVSGTYKIECVGAQGSNYGSYSGGKGGYVSGDIKLSPSDKVKIVIGGQNGYNRGGTGKLSNGGGATEIYINNKLAITAGGGGGACLLSNGGNGGLTSSLTTGNTGGSSTTANTAGGGGGYVGGKYGYVTYHSHNNCEYGQVGTTGCSGGGGTGTWYWSDYHQTGYYQRTCPVCGKTSISSGSWVTCDNISPVYGYKCGKSTSTVESNISSGGGSNYVDTEIITNSTSSSSEGNGNGYVKLTLVG